MSKEKKLLITTIILGAMLPICAFGLSFISEAFIILGIFSGISAVLCLIIYLDLREGKKPKLIPLGFSMAFFGFVFLGISDFYQLVTIPVSALYAVVGLITLAKGIKDWHNASRNRPKVKKPMNKKIYIGIGLLVGGYVEAIVLFSIYPFLMAIGHVMIVAGIIFLGRGIAQRKNGISSSNQTSNRAFNDTVNTVQVKKEYCARCKRSIIESETVWLGSYRFCRECAPSHADAKKSTDTQREKSIQIRRLVNVLEQIHELKKKEELSEICTICRRLFSSDKIIFADGECYCEDCYRFTYNKGHKEKTIAIDELYQISYEISGLCNQSLHSRVVEIADRLIVGGFEFHGAHIGGGVDEISHSGVMAYSASYTGYNDFKNHMESDLQKRKQEERKNSGGWICSLDYSYICAFLTRKTLKVYILSEYDHIILRWIDTSDKAFATTRVFAENVIKDVYDNKCKLKQIDNMELHSTFLSNWN